MKTWDFGQGNTDPRLLEKMSGRYPDVHPGGVMQDTRLRRATRESDDGEDYENDQPPDVR